MNEFLFWGALAYLGYSYLGFWLLVLLRAHLRPRPFRRADIRPTVSLIIVAHDEAGSIAAKLEEVLSSGYPRDRLEVVVASDGSRDATETIVAGYTGRGVRLLSLPRVGKIRALDAAAGCAHGEILVFSDANSRFAPGWLPALLRPFADPQVGGVAADQRYLKQRRGARESAGERSYWGLDRRLKAAESRGGNVTSATGALYAIRRSLFRPLPPGVTDDFAASTGVIAQGYRLVFEPQAVAYEQVAASDAAEFRRKVRVITRGLRGVVERRELLNPLRFGFYSVQLLSHKILRRLAFLPLLTLLVVSPGLWSRGPIFQLAVIAQAAFYGGALLGFLLRGRAAGAGKCLTLPFYFVLVNLACAIAVVNLLRGRRIDVWEPSHNLPSLSGAHR